MILNHLGRSPTSKRITQFYSSRTDHRTFYSSAKKRCLRIRRFHARTCSENYNSCETNNYLTRLDISSGDIAERSYESCATVIKSF